MVRRSRCSSSLKIPQKLRRDEPHLLCGSGGFSISLTPSFPFGVLAWMEMGGLYFPTQPAGRWRIRRGLAPVGHEAQEAERFRRLRRRTAEWLIANQYTSSTKPNHFGRVERRPPGQPAWHSGRIYSTCACQPCRRDGHAPVFHNSTIGWAWVDELWVLRRPGAVRVGSSLTARCTTSSRVPAPPPTLITTTDLAERAALSQHSFKFAARCKPPSPCDKPVLIRIETKAVQGTASPRGSSSKGNR